MSARLLTTHLQVSAIESSLLGAMKRSGVMLWALGFEEELGRPDKIVDVPRAVGFCVT